MLSPKLYEDSHKYDLFMRVFGFEASVERFLKRCKIPAIQDGQILDNGCGSGTIGIHFLEASNNSTLLSTDLEPNFLDAAQKKAQRRGIVEGTMQVGIANISNPEQVTTLDQSELKLSPNTFQLICLGAVLGYAENPESSLRTLVHLLQPGGYLLNLEMSETMLGRYVSQRYHYKNISLDEMEEILKGEGCSVEQKTMGWSYFPACMTRTSLIARKNNT